METVPSVKFSGHRVQSTLFWAIILSETSHVFCCVLPTLISLFSLLAGLGLMSVMPAGLLAFHTLMHRWEIPMIGMSASVLAIGWGLHFLALRLDDCDSDCGHGACAPKQKNAAGVLKLASVLFFVNVTIYYVFHVHMHLLQPGVFQK